MKMKVWLTFCVICCLIMAAGYTLAGHGTNAIFSGLLAGAFYYLLRTEK